MSDIGYCKQSGMGLLPLEWVDIKAYSDLTGLELSAEESKTIKRLSTAFVNQMSDSKYENSKPPFVDDRVVDMSIDSLMNDLFKGW